MGSNPVAGIYNIPIGYVGNRGARGDTEKK
jgi:hypothetical protein